MEALYLLVPLSIAIVFAAIWLFFRMSDDGQFDDLVSPGWRILQDDDRAAASENPADTGTVPD
ncbi:cytochrome oxidase maturation protein Cbb3 [Herbaspirillum hiltneri N3]|uniref:Cytochrome oxidase maturation protein Cbb3 n=1 Tax=Herbaspirillum hiltneri N3 TaxID=1262470 RepID=A0ABN4HWP1_9BURK|nr:cbb3-type cytochrome oxidase assembly protein CcoS [Herbaspirillum hiltneri]AKZ63420.1 cytochrome oxidase maturation protein Cbb3 [Herbaspirillum hiltneri N3]